MGYRKDWMVISFSFPCAGVVVFNTSVQDRRLGNQWACPSAAGVWVRLWVSLITGANPATAASSLIKPVRAMLCGLGACILPTIRGDEEQQLGVKEHMHGTWLSVIYFQPLPTWLLSNVNIMRRCREDKPARILKIISYRIYYINNANIMILNVYIYINMCILNMPGSQHYFSDSTEPV